MSAIRALPFQDNLEAFCGATVKIVRRMGKALYHFNLYKFGVEYFTRILKAFITVEENRGSQVILSNAL